MPRDEELESLSVIQIHDKTMIYLNYLITILTSQALAKSKSLNNGKTELITNSFHHDKLRLARVTISLTCLYRFLRAIIGFGILIG